MRNVFRLLSRVFGPVLGLTAVIVLFIIAPALADTASAAAPTTTISLGPIWDAVSGEVESILVVIVTVLIGWLAKKANDLLHVKIEQKYQDDLHRAAVTGINAALTKFGGYLNDQSIDVKSAIVADAVNWIIKSVPDAVKKLDAGGKLDGLVKAKLEEILGLPSVPDLPTAPTVTVVPAPAPAAVAVTVQTAPASPALAPAA